jgi:exodeoxyribonuclease VII large subunit
VVGVVTSPAAAAWRDVLSTLRRRFPALEVILYPTAVQGAGAAEAIAAALDLASARAECDVLILARGGGSIEDLWAFNEEPVAAAIFRSKLPVVSGVGHETDFTIADFVADVRAPTPTGAAMLVAPDGEAWRRACRVLAARLSRAGERALEGRMQAVDQLARRLKHPVAALRLRQEHLARAGERLGAAWALQHQRRDWQLSQLAARTARLLAAPMPQLRLLAEFARRLPRAGERQLERVGTRLHQAVRSLALLDPQQVLDRGYAIVTRGDGKVLREASAAQVGEDLDLRLARGSLAATVKSHRTALPTPSTQAPEIPCPKP